MLSSSSSSSSLSPPPLIAHASAIDTVAAAEAETDAEADAVTATAVAVELECSTYAGPMRWRWNPGGRGAKTQTLRALPLADAPALRPRAPPLRSFPARELRLLPGTRFASAAATNVAFLKALEPARLFWTLRATAGLPQPPGARPYGGWEAPGAGIRGHFVGHYLGALGTASAAAPDDAALRGRVDDALVLLEACQRAHTARGAATAGYLSAFPPREFEEVEKLCDPPPPGGCRAWVPHYAVHKLLAGLLAMHEALGRAAAGALPLVLGMADYLWRRAAAARLAYGTAAWREGLNYEVGALSETYAQLAALTSNASWLRAAALFDRACFTGPLALAGAHHRREPRAGGGGGGGGGSDFGGIGKKAQPDLTARGRRAGREREWWQSAEEQAAAEAAMRGMHANANLAYILGAAARYELTGESRARDAVLAFWRQLQGAYSYVTGGSSYQEEWRQPWAQPRDLEARGASIWPAHDHQESCVTHNTMLLSRRLAAWSGAPRPRAEDGELQAKGSEGGGGGESSAPPPPRGDGASGLLAHAEWYERALHNGVLGTQRGVQPGAMVYMLPLGGGVSKAGGNHKWSNGESRAQPRLQPEPRSPPPPEPPPASPGCVAVQTFGAAWVRASRPSLGCTTLSSSRAATARWRGWAAAATAVLLPMRTVVQGPRRARAGQRVGWRARRRARRNCTRCSWFRPSSRGWRVAASCAWRPTRLATCPRARYSACGCGFGPPTAHGAVRHAARACFCACQAGRWLLRRRWCGRAARR